MSPDRFEMLSAYLDDELGDDERVECERMLFQDDELRETYRALRVMRGDLLEEPPPAELPLRLDLALTRLADDFMAADTEPAAEVVAEPEAQVAVLRPVETPSFWNHGRAGFGAGDTTDAPIERPWFQMTAAVGLALLAVIGMGIFAQRGGSALSSVERRVHGLTDFGHEAMYTHAAQAKQLPPHPVDTVAGLESMLAKRLVVPVDLPQRRLGAPRDARTINLDGHTVAMADYAFHHIPVSMFALPRELGVELLDLTFEPIRNACGQGDVHQCFTDGRGTSLCVQTEPTLVRLWVSHLPMESLDKLVRKPQ